MHLAHPRANTTAAHRSCAHPPAFPFPPSPAQRCRVHSTLFMPLYDSPRRDACVGVFEVVLTDPEPNFAGMVGWIM